jgi:putative peptide zinc metalloprotease protein
MSERERPTFSPLWHRIRALRPRLRPHVQITRQHYRGRRWHVVHDPTSNQFYRLNPIAHEMVGMLDGKRSVEEIWNISLQRHGDAAPTQGETLELVSQLYNSNLLAADVTPETEQLLRRGRERFKKKAASQAIGIMYFRMRLFNPDRMLTWLEPIMRPILNRWGFLAWCAWIGLGLYFLIPNLGDLMSGFESALAPSNWGWLIVVFIVSKALHETGHGVICKRFGGQVPEFGMMLLVLFPAPYVDASACWAFSNKWRRMAVGAGGMIFELALATAAVLVWVNADGGLVKQIAYNVIFTASISTVLFNANPLMRFDGYYILSDLLEVPNLMQRSMNQIKFYFQRYVYRIKDARPPTTVGAERVILTIYGIAALAYRIFLFVSITLFVMGKLFALGLILAAWTAAMWFILPVGKFVHWLATSPQLTEFRPRAIVTTLLMIGAGLFLLGGVPVPEHRRAPGVVECEQRSGVFFGVDGFVETVHKRIGDRVEEGEPILTLANPSLLAQRDVDVAELARLESLVGQAMMESPQAAPTIRRSARAQREHLARVEEWIEKLVVRAPHDGVIVSRDPAELAGRFVTRGDALCEVVDLDDLHVTAAMSTVVAGPLQDLVEQGKPFGTDVRMRSDPHMEHQASSVTLIEVGQRVIPHASLGFQGGGDIATDPQDQYGLVANKAQFLAEISLATEVWNARPGERVVVRFTLPKRSLLGQWAGRLQRMVQGRVNL